jgi:hypothetical protein
VYQAVLAWIVLVLMCAECVPKRQVGFADDDRVLVCGSGRCELSCSIAAAL